MVSYTIKLEGFEDKANRTLRPQNVDPNDYPAAFIGGGVGPMFDVASNAHRLAVIAHVYEKGGVLGSGGHGPGSFGNVKLSSGKYLVAGKRITRYANVSELNKRWTTRRTTAISSEGPLA